MLLAAANEHKLNLSRSFMVGDRWRDIEAGRRAGCQTILIDSGSKEQSLDTADVVVTNIGQAVDWILLAADTGESSRD
jgi:D-glycero-D-manno-heptose 1,7-bisphosphate phosphatase